MMTRFALTAALAVLAAAPAVAAPSGMLLGIYARPQAYGLGVAGFIPGYSAETVLRRGDQIMRATADGANVYPVRTVYDLEQIKSTIGPHVDVALEVYRPGVGTQHCWVTFTPLGDTPTAAATAVFTSEVAKPGARSLFSGGSSARPPQTRPSPNPPSAGPRPTPRPGGRPSAGDLFRRR